jgi:accessory colonization factor AcfC
MEKLIRPAKSKTTKKRLCLGSPLLEDPKKAALNLDILEDICDNDMDSYDKDKIKKNPKNIGAWISLIKNMRMMAASNSSEQQHADAWAVCKKALEANPDSKKLIQYANEYRQYLDALNYPAE